MAKTELTLRPFLWRAEKLFPDKEIVSYGADGEFRYTYAEYTDRVAQLANALEAAGIEQGDAVGTFCWNHHRHFETYFGVPEVGGVLHTINVMLPDEHVTYLIEDAADKLLFVDPEALDQIERLYREKGLSPVEQYVVMDSEVPDTDLEPVTDYESFIDGHSTTYEGPRISEEDPAAMCYTSGTTGKPKGVEYTHKMLWTQMMATMTPNGYGFDEGSVILQTVPMFHIVGWGWPYEAATLGAKIVFPGPSPDSADLAHIIEEESVTFTGGVPTVWLEFLEYVDDHEVDLSSLERVFNGGSRPPKSLIQRFEKDYNVEYRSASGMTEVTALATTAEMKSAASEWDNETRRERSQKAGLILPGMEFRVIDDDGNEVPWDGETVGELYYRGPWVADQYYERPDKTEEKVVDGWLKTGDLVTVDEEGYIDIVDRKDDMIKSGGEWISSVDLENTIMDHDAVAEAAVVGIDHEKWQERPVAFVVLTDDADRVAVIDELPDIVQSEYPKWWTPDSFEVIEEIPKTSTEKFDKKRLREDFAAPSMVEEVSEEAAPEGT